MQKKMISLFTAAMMCAGLLSGCGSQSSSASAAAASASSETASSADDLVSENAGTYICPDDESTITLSEDGSVDVSLTRLADLEGTAVSGEDGTLTFKVTDPNDSDMTLSFDPSAGVLTVSESTWDLLEEGTTISFERQ